MQKYLQLYIKIFLCFSLLFGIGISVAPQFLTGLLLNHSWRLIISEIGRTAPIVWTLSLASGALFSLMAATFHILRVRSLPTHDPENILSVFQTRSFTLPMSQESAFKTCISSLMTVNAKMLEQKSPLQIKAQTPFGWKSWGEKIEFSLAQISDTDTRVQFSSRPKIITTLIDYGADIEIVEKIYWYLEEKGNQNKVIA